MRERERKGGTFRANKTAKPEEAKSDTVDKKVKESGIAYMQSPKE